MVEFAVQEADVVSVPSDLLLLKHAQGFYGVDKAVAMQLISAKLCTPAKLQPPPGEFVVIETKGIMAPAWVLFLGTPPLAKFAYVEMQQFADQAIEAIADLHMPVRLVTTTVHGMGYGLDGGEALQRLVRGFRQGLSRCRSAAIERITFLTLEKRAERILSTALETVQGTDASPAPAMVSDSRDVEPSPLARPARGRPAGRAAPGLSSVSPTVQAGNKKRVFVAMPFSEEFQNVYEFGIYPAVRNCGLICERVDETHFTGDVLGRIREGIESADLVIADLTDGRPNVYLEVGFAWGKNIPVVFVARKGEKLHFDVSTHRCIFYGSFTQFAKDLEGLIRGIGATVQR